jgi:molecular chaperone DnaK (HSP70)
VLIHVVQGERDMAEGNRSLARFELQNIEPLPAGLARIEVRFLIDANGILNVSARDLHTGKEQSVAVKPSYGLTDDEVDAMITDSVEQSVSDFQRRQVIEARLEADTILAATEKALAHDAWQELGDQEHSQIRKALGEMQLAYHSDDYTLIRSYIAKLNEATTRLAELIMDAAVNTAVRGKSIDEV